MALALGLAGGGLTACGETAEAPAGEAAGAVEAVPGLTIENARLVLNAVAGNPAAIYLDMSYDGERATTVRAASVEGAEKTELHETSEWERKMVMGEMGPLLLNPGDSVTFEPGGKHIMVFGLPDTVEPGQDVDVTLTVVGGDKTSFTAEVVAAGADR
ncbi:copper chaperone PCu(A)C [Qipengyuania sp. DSG2-2]|uniref:copper chaperone PCu(A)C n=1 Tax=Qipengyuania sp. DGS2-2 TaxID=3349631 RepID=UPI0036D33B77